jgi:hypothetical protein
MESDAMKSVDAAEAEQTITSDDKVMNEELPTTSESSMDYSEIVAQKLQEFADLQTLIQKHPKFKTDLQFQLATMSTDSLLLELSGDSISITDISQIGIAEVISDTVKNIPFSFIIRSPSTVRKDSLIAVFTIRKVEIDGQLLVSNKVTFESLRK